MFTGIITGVGRISTVEDLGTVAQRFGKRLTLEVPAGYLDDVSPGDSIALNGACMTLTGFDAAARHFTVDISAESLACTTGLDSVGTPVNLEKALRANDRLGGHIVSGHVDGVGSVQALAPVGESWGLQILAPIVLARYLACKGSITVNGVSLTINRLDDVPYGAVVYINLIPHTMENTALRALRKGSSVNLEIDTVARYVERMLTLDSKGRIPPEHSRLHSARG